LQRIRIKQAEKFIEEGQFVLDVGCHQGEVFDQLNFKKIRGFGIDPVLDETISKPNYTLLPGKFPEDFNVRKEFDAVTLLAVLEHVPENELIEYPQTLSRFLKEGGLVIVTVPSKIVDIVLFILKSLRLIDGMDLGNHQDFPRKKIIESFTRQGYSLVVRKKFELGLNNLFVFRKN